VAKRGVLLLAAVAIAACGSTDRPAPSGLVGGTDVGFTTRDGVRISGTLRLPPGARQRPAPAVVLVHQPGSDRHDFNALLPSLRRAGYATLTYDIRGMGRSNAMIDGTVYRPGADRAAYIATMPRDVAAALRYLRGRADIASERLAVIGSSVGANIALAASAPPDGPAATVGISPVAGVLTRATAERRRPRGVLLIADRVEIGSAWALARRVDRPKRVSLASREGHGVRLVPDRHVQEEILSWLARRLRVAD
jgi:alpha-beta hydrolase superfamily lysophospholipase